MKQRPNRYSEKEKQQCVFASLTPPIKGLKKENESSKYYLYIYMPPFSSPQKTHGLLVNHARCNEDEKDQKLDERDQRRREEISGLVFRKQLLSST